MDINSDDLNAFLLVHEYGSFSEAARRMHLTQSALSQKIAKLEDQMEATLFLRKTSGIKLSHAGEKFFLFAKQQLKQQEEFLQHFHSKTSEIVGVCRLASFSSVLRSLIVPTLSPWLRENPKVQMEFSSFEVDALIPSLKSNRTDMVIVDYEVESAGIETLLLGYEEYVLIESREYPKAPNIYLDHDQNDHATENFFKFQGQHSTIKRAFMGDTYGIMDGVAQGLGRAVMSKHLVEKDQRFKMIKAAKRYYCPLTLCYLKQSYYPLVHRHIRDELKASRSLLKREKSR